LQESAVVYVFYNYVDRFVWTLSSTNNSTEAYSTISYNKYALPLQGQMFKIDNLLSINKFNYETGRLQIGINEEFINFIVDLYQQEQQAIDVINKSTIANDQKQKLNALVNAHKINAKNCNDAINTICKYPNSYLSLINN